MRYDDDDDDDDGWDADARASVYVCLYMRTRAHTGRPHQARGIDPRRPSVSLVLDAHVPEARLDHLHGEHPIPEVLRRQRGANDPPGFAAALRDGRSQTLKVGKAQGPAQEARHRSLQFGRAERRIAAECNASQCHRGTGPGCGGCTLLRTG